MREQESKEEKKRVKEKSNTANASSADLENS